jgi:hypothetical protein
MDPRNYLGFDEAADRSLYADAVSRGLERTGWAGEEQVSRPVELLACATELTPALALVATSLVHEPAESRGEQREALKIAGEISAGLVRAAHWAREVHARDVGYDTEAWIRQAIARAGHLTYEQDKDCTRVLEHLDEAAAQLSEAIVALESDRLAVADSITQAQGCWLAIYVRAREALNT